MKLVDMVKKPSRDETLPMSVVECRITWYVLSFMSCLLIFHLAVRFLFSLSMHHPSSYLAWSGWAAVLWWQARAAFCCLKGVRNKLCRLLFALFTWFDMQTTPSILATVSDIPAHADVVQCCPVLKQDWACTIQEGSDSSLQLPVSAPDQSLEKLECVRTC